MTFNVLAFEGGLVVVALGLGALFGVRPFGSFAWDWGAVGAGIAATLPPLLLLVITWRSDLDFLVRLKKKAAEILETLFAEVTTVDLAVFSILAGVGEEALFRGVIQVAVADWIGIWPGILIAGLLFGAAHAITAGYIVYATVVGVYLGGLLIWTDNLLAPIVTHAAYDFVALYWYLNYGRKEDGNVDGAGTTTDAENPPMDG